MAATGANREENDQIFDDALSEPQQPSGPPPPWADKVDLAIKRRATNRDVLTWVDIDEEAVAVELNKLGLRDDDTSQRKPIQFAINQLDGTRNKIRIYKSSGIVYKWVSGIPGIKRYDEVKFDSWDTANVRIRYPYGPIYHEKQQAKSKLFHSDLSSLSGNDRRNVEAFRILCEDPLIKRYLANPWMGELTKDTEIRFDDVWKVFKPGSFVKVKTLSNRNSMRKINAVNRSPRVESCSVSCVSMCWNGNSFREMRSVLKIPAYSGTRKLDSFRGQPIPEPDVGKSDILDWVKSGLQYCRYWNSKQVTVKEYEGIGLPIPSGYASDSEDSEGESKDTEIIRGRIVIDPKAIERNSSLVKTRNLNSEDVPLWEKLPSDIQQLTSTELSDLSPHQARKLSDTQLNQLAQCPVAIPAFSLSKDDWYLVVVNDLERPKYAGMQAWQSIVGSDPFRAKLEKLRSLVLAWSQATSPSMIKQLSSVTEMDEVATPNRLDEKDIESGAERDQGAHISSLTFWKKLMANESPKPSRTKEKASRPFPRRGEVRRSEPKPGHLSRRQSSALDTQGKPGDITRIDKGQGLVVMLYGPPGVGKTMTAECLADLIRKPLYRVDLGQVTSQNLEAEIDRIFKNAEHWNAVLLLDEAEAIMVERTPDNMDQNTWVSGKFRGQSAPALSNYSVAFLRKVEYFRGILILTTNLIHLIDPAFESRITYAIEYTSMRDSETIRREVWRKFVEEIVTPSHSSKPSQQKIYAWARKAVNLNARQIRNICHSAEILANSSEKAQNTRSFSGVQVKSVEDWIDHMLSDTDEFIGAIVKAKKATEEQYMKDLY